MEAGQFWPGKKKPHKSSWTRWANPKKGCRGVVLETVLLAGERFTSRESIHRFLAAVSRAEARRGLASNSPPPAGVPPVLRGRRDRQRAIHEAEQRLAAAGL